MSRPPPPPSADGARAERPAAESSADAAAQDEEVEALRAVLGDEAVVVRSNEWGGGARGGARGAGAGACADASTSANATTSSAPRHRVVLDVALPRARATLRVRLPPDYPSRAGPELEWAGSRAGLRALDDVQAGFAPGEPALVAMVLAVDEAADADADGDGDDDHDHDRDRDHDHDAGAGAGANPTPAPGARLDGAPAAAAQRARPAGAHAGPGTAEGAAPAARPALLGEPVAWHSAPPTTVLKSVFVGHAARVTSAEEARRAVAQLVQRPKIAQATHNMWAYRVDLGRGAFASDNDDDGEDAAGGRLAELLHLSDAKNVVVCVSRWYGGVKLGGARFRVIMNAGKAGIEALLAAEGAAAPPAASAGAGGGRKR